MYRLTTIAAAIAIATQLAIPIALANPEPDATTKIPECQSPIVLRGNGEVAHPSPIVPSAHFDPNWDSLQYED